MAWVRLEGGFPEHRKILGLSDAAFRLHILAICYAARMLSDGTVPRIWLTGGKGRTVPKAVDQLVSAGVWESRDDGDYLIHDYLEYQPSRVRVTEHQDQMSLVKAEAGRKGGLAKASNARAQKLADASTPLTTTDSTQVATQNSKPLAPIPSLPSPSNPSPIVAAATTGPRPYDRTHANHVNAFCDFKCLTDVKLGEFAKDLPGGLSDPENFNRALTWAENVRDTWGDKPKVEFHWYDFWEARWQEHIGASKPQTRGAQAVATGKAWADRKMREGQS